jgi:hypothetical protein
MRISLAALREFASTQREHGQFHAAGSKSELAHSDLADDCVFYRIEEVASMLQVTPRHVHRLKSSALACDHFGRSARISLLSLRRYIADSRTQRPNQIVKGK